MFKLMFPVMLYLIPITAAVWGYAWSINALGEYIYTQTAKPFLDLTVVTTVPHKLTTAPLQIEYSVLKVPMVSKTVAKK